MRAGCLRNELGKVDVYLLIIFGIRVGSKRLPHVCSVLCLEKFKGYLVRREYRCGSTELCAHVGDGSSFGNGESLYALAHILDDLAYAALYAHYAKHLKYNVLSGYPGLQLSCKVHLYYLGAGDVVCAAAHCNSNVLSACTDSYHAYTAACGGMGVRAYECLSGNAESLEVYLMTDAVSGA